MDCCISCRPDLPVSLAGAIRAAGPLLTFAAGILLFDEPLGSLKVIGLAICIGSYYYLAVAGRSGKIDRLPLAPTLAMASATVLSALTTIYDRVLVLPLGMDRVSVQYWPSIQRCLLSFAALSFVCIRSGGDWRLARAHLSVVLVGISWVTAECPHFLAIQQPDAQVSVIAIFRRMSLVVGFIAAVFLFRE